MVLLTPLDTKEFGGEEECNCTAKLRYKVTNLNFSQKLVSFPSTKDRRKMRQTNILGYILEPSITKLRSILI